MCRKVGVSTPRLSCAQVPQVGVGWGVDERGAGGTGRPLGLRGAVHRGAPGAEKLRAPLDCGRRGSRGEAGSWGGKGVGR